MVIASHPTGFFGKALALVAALCLLAITLVFSLIFLAVLISVALVFLAYAWWASKRARKSARVPFRE